MIIREQTTFLFSLAPRSVLITAIYLFDYVYSIKHYSNVKIYECECTHLQLAESRILLMEHKYPLYLYLYFFLVFMLILG